MSDELLLAIDAGTGSLRAVLFDADGNQVAIGQAEYSHPEHPGAPGSQNFRTDENWNLVGHCIRQALQAAQVAPSAVQAVSATSMREGMVLYDHAGKELWACPNVDARAGEEAAELIASGAADEIYQIAGDWVAITAPARLRWIARHQPEVFDSIAHVGMIGDWILYRLCGEFVTDPSLGSSSGMFDLRRRGWSERIFELCGLDPAVVPAVIDPGTAVGVVSAAAAAETGLAAGTPVVVGGADTQLALVGLGVGEPGRFTVVGGSFWQHTVVLDEPLTDPQARLRTLCHAVPDRWMMEGIGFYCGIVMRWFRDAFCAAERAEAELLGADVYELLDHQAAALGPGSNGVLAIFSNLMNDRRWVHATPSFLGLDVAQPSEARLACFRAIEESAGYVSKGHLAIVEEVARLSVDEVVFAGGASKSALWAQILADTLGMPVRVPVVREATALGAALLAGAGVGLYADAVAVAEKLLRYERTFEPDPARVAAYAVLYDRWSDVYRRMLELTEAGLARPLWRAPGI